MLTDLPLAAGIIMYAFGVQVCIFLIEVIIFNNIRGASKFFQDLKAESFVCLLLVSGTTSPIWKILAVLESPFMGKGYRLLFIGAI